MSQDQSVGPDPITYNITLHPDGVSAPALRAMQESAEIIALAISAMDATDLSKAPTIQGTIMGFEVRGPEIGADDRRRQYVNWLLSKGFQEIARGVRASLEEGLLFVEIAKLAGAVMTFGEYKAAEVAIKTRAAKLNFPDLMSAVNRGLVEPLHFEREFLSLQKVRNCLEHRRGVVAAGDADPQSDQLTLALPRLKTTVSKPEGEVEVEGPMRVEEGEVISIQRGTREIAFGVGDQVSFTVDQFYEIAFASYFFATDLVAKLPKLRADASSAANSAQPAEGRSTA